MSKVTITYEDIAVGAAEAATATAAGKQDFCSLPDIFGGETIPQYGTLEQDYLQLNGTWPQFLDMPSSAKLGLWSKQLSGADGVFATTQEIDIVLSANYTSTGISLFFDPYGPTWCKDLTIEWYRGDTLLSSKVFNPDGPVYFCDNAVTSYNKVVITCRAMSAPCRYLKLFRLKFGRVKIFEPKEYKNLSMMQEADPISDTVADNALSVTFRPTENISYMYQSKQRLTVKEDAELIGVWYIDTHDKTGANAYDVDGISLIGMLARADDHMGGLYTGQTAASVAADIMGSIPYVLASDLQAVPIYGFLPIASPRDNLKQLCFAIGAVVDDSRREYVYIRKPDAGAATDSFVGGRAYEKGKISSASMVTRVELTVHRYTLGASQEQLFSAALNGTERLEFGEPCSGLAISGGTLGDHGANYAVITGRGGVVTLTGIKYIHTTSVMTKTNPLKTASDTDNPKKITDITLITPDNAQARLDMLYAHYLRVRTVKGKVVLQNNYPGQRVRMETVAGDIVTGNIVSMDWHVSATQAADVEVLADPEAMT